MASRTTTHDQQLLDRVEKLRRRADRAREQYEAAVTEHHLAVLEAYEVMGATDLGRALGIHRQRVYQLVYSARSRDGQDSDQ